MSRDIPRKKVVIVVMSGNMLLNFAGPSDVFTNANSILTNAGSSPGYDILIAAPSKDREVIGQTGVKILCPYCVMEIAQPIDTLMIAGNDRSAEGDLRLTDFHKWLSCIESAKTRRIASVCGGAFALAKAGLLDGKKATTHWERTEYLKKEYPAIQLEAQQFFTSDGNIYTSAGV